MSKGRRHMSHVQRTAGFDDDYKRAEASAVVPQTVVTAEEVAGDRPKANRYRKADRVHIVRKPHLDGILSSAYVTAMSELRELEKKVASGERLATEDLERYQLLVDAVSKLARVEREQVKDERMADVEMSELKQLAREALKALPDDD